MYSQVLIYKAERTGAMYEKLAQGFNAAARDSNPGSHSGESESLPLSHCAAMKCLCVWLENSPLLDTVVE